MSVAVKTYREMLSRLRQSALEGGLYKQCWQEGTLGWGGGVGPGPHYRRPDCYGIVSPSEEECSVLFLLSRLAMPACIVEYGTGTGIGTACLAMGAPTATVYTADLYSPLYTRGADLSETARELWKRLEITNVEFFVEDWSVLPRMVRERHLAPGIIFGDGDIKLPEFDTHPNTNETTIYILHDFSSSSSVSAPRRNGWVMLNSSTWLAFSSDNFVVHNLCTRVATLVVTPERILQLRCTPTIPGANPNITTCLLEGFHAGFSTPG